MTQKHTPGPWGAFDSSNGKTWVRLAEFQVAQVTGNDHEANARLIAAAPDLMHFAREFDEACAIKAGQGAKAVLGITELNRLWDMARAAIAKAEGRS